jgi:hypothetical protein
MKLMHDLSGSGEDRIGDCPCRSQQRAAEEKVGEQQRHGFAPDPADQALT